MSEYNKYTPTEESMYNLNTYWGRVCHFARITDVR